MAKYNESTYSALANRTRNNELTNIEKLELSADFMQLLKLAAVDKQWLVKRSRYNQDAWAFFEAFIDLEVKKELPDHELLKKIDFTRGIPAAITTHHRLLKDAFENYIIKQFETVGSFDYNIERDGILPLKKVLFYLSLTFNIDTNNEKLIQAMGIIQDKMAQALFSSTMYLLTNTAQTTITSSIEIEWLIAQFLNSTRGSVIAYVIGQWTRKMVAHALINRRQNVQTKEPVTDEEKEMIYDINMLTQGLNLHE